MMNRMMTRRRISAATALLGTIVMAWAGPSLAANGPLTGIPSGLGANGSESFSPAPAIQPSPTTGIGTQLPVGRPSGAKSPRILKRRS